MSNAVKTQGTILKRGDGGGSEVFTAIAEVVDFDGPDGQASEIDVTHLGSTRKEFLMGLPDEGKITLTVNWVPGDAQQVGLRTDRDAQTSRNFKILFADTGGTVASFAAFVLGLPMSVKADSKVEQKITLRITGAITWTP